jgi:hypothetical protein
MRDRVDADSLICSSEVGEIGLDSPLSLFAVAADRDACRASGESREPCPRITQHDNGFSYHTAS